MRLKKKISTAELAQMWVDLNTWKRPKRLKDHLPENIHEAPPGLVNTIMTMIEFSVGPEPINAQWEKHCDKMDKRELK